MIKRIILFPLGLFAMLVWFLIHTVQMLVLAITMIVKWTLNTEKFDDALNEAIDEHIEAFDNLRKLLELEDSKDD